MNIYYNIGNIVDFSEIKINIGITAFKEDKDVLDIASQIYIDRSCLVVTSPHEIFYEINNLISFTSKYYNIRDVVKEFSEQSMTLQIQDLLSIFEDDISNRSKNITILRRKIKQMSEYVRAFIMKNKVLIYEKLNEININPSFESKFLMDRVNAVIGRNRTYISVWESRLIDFITTSGVNYIPIKK